MYQTHIRPDGHEEVLIHMIVPGTRPETVACLPNRKVPCPIHRTNDPRGVTCPSCKQTPLFQQALAENSVVRRAV
jgi:hypothetical protein